MKTFLNIAELLTFITIFSSLFIYILYVLNENKNIGIFIFTKIFPSTICKIIVISFIAKIFITILSLIFVKFSWGLLIISVFDCLVVHIWWNIYKDNYNKEFELYKQYQKEKELEALTALKEEDEE